MIKVLIKYEGNIFKSLVVKGHAGSGPHGHDIVCAGVSAVVIGGINNLESPKSYSFNIKEGLAEIKAIDEISTHDQIVIETIVCGLKTIAETYGDFIKIENL